MCFLKQAKEAVGSRLASTKDDANETLSSARTKTADALSSFKDSASKAWEAGKSAVMNSPNSEDDENGPLVAFKKDEVDLTPEEQFTRHHVELDPSKLHHYHQQQQQQRREGEGTFEHLKTTAVRFSFFSFFSLHAPFIATCFYFPFFRVVLCALLVLPSSITSLLSHTHPIIVVTRLHHLLLPHQPSLWKA